MTFRDMITATNKALNENRVDDAEVLMEALLAVTGGRKNINNIDEVILDADGIELLRRKIKCLRDQLFLSAFLGIK